MNKIIIQGAKNVNRKTQITYNHRRPAGGAGTAQRHIHHFQSARHWQAPARRF
jgi:hypothetical protein